MKIVEFLHMKERISIQTGLENWLADRRINLSAKVQVNQNEDFPKLCDFDLAVLHGGRQHLWNKDAAPWLYGEVEYVRMMLHAGKPVVGFGMGAGILAQALGAPAYRCDDAAEGYYSIQPWREGWRHPLLNGLKEGFYAYVDHNDHYALPAHTSLAHSILSTHAIFVSNNLPAAGFQFRLMGLSEKAELSPALGRLIENILMWFGLEEHMETSQTGRKA